MDGQTLAQKVTETALGIIGVDPYTSTFILASAFAWFLLYLKVEQYQRQILALFAVGILLLLLI